MREGVSGTREGESGTGEGVSASHAEAPGTREEVSGRFRLKSCRFRYRNLCVKVPRALSSHAKAFSHMLASKSPLGMHGNDLELTLAMMWMVSGEEWIVG